MKHRSVVFAVGLGLFVLASCQRSTQHSAAPQSSAPHGAGEYAIAITDRGFEPAETTIPKGQAVTLVFTRTTDQTCATEVVFPALHQRHPLPLNEPVRVSLPASAAGTIQYACGMNMLSGSVVVR